MIVHKTPLYIIQSGQRQCFGFGQKKPDPDPTLKKNRIRDSLYLF